MLKGQNGNTNKISLDAVRQDWAKNVQPCDTWDFDARFDGDEFHLEFYASDQELLYVEAIEFQKAELKAAFKLLEDGLWVAVGVGELGWYHCRIDVTSAQIKSATLKLAIGLSCDSDWLVRTSKMPIKAVRTLFGEIAEDGRSEQLHHLAARLSDTTEPVTMCLDTLQNIIQHADAIYYFKET